MKGTFSYVRYWFRYIFFEFKNAVITVIQSFVEVKNVSTLISTSQTSWLRKFLMVSEKVSRRNKDLMTTIPVYHSRQARLRLDFFFHKASN